MILTHVGISAAAAAAAAETVNPPSWAVSAHYFTAACWALGDTIRFGCFFFDGLASLASNGSVPGGVDWKLVRYTAGPFFFPLGSAGELAMIIAVVCTMTGTTVMMDWCMRLLVLVWPVGFFPLMRQLLAQRRKHIARTYN